MSFIRRHSRLLLVAVSCIALGAGASLIASAGAATGGSGHAGRSGHARIGALRRLARRATHGTIVLDTKRGFVTVSFDRGTVDSVNGQQLTITEGARKAAHKRTVTLTIPANARVRDNHQKATLSAVKPGQRVVVITAPKRTLVAAHTPRTA